MDMEQFEKLNAEADRRLSTYSDDNTKSLREDMIDCVRSKGLVVIDIATAKLLQLQVHSRAFCNPTQAELDKIDSEISKTQSAMRGR